MPMNIKNAASIMGRKGGKNGTGESKRRGSEYYKKIAIDYWSKHKKPLAERFWEKVDKKAADECWNWTGCKARIGYGFINVEGKNRSAHRVAYELHHGMKAKNHVLHRCDNRACCNPNHLFEGTHSENMADRDRKGRNNHGEKQHFHKLTTEDVIKIRSDGRIQRDIASDYGVCTRTIYSIKTRRNWKHIP